MRPSGTSLAGGSRTFFFFSFSSWSETQLMINFFDLSKKPNLDFDEINWFIFCLYRLVEEEEDEERRFSVYFLMWPRKA